MIFIKWCLPTRRIFCEVETVQQPWSLAKAPRQPASPAVRYGQDEIARRLAVEDENHRLRQHIRELSARVGGAGDERAAALADESERLRQQVTSLEGALEEARRAQARASEQTEISVRREVGLFPIYSCLLFCWLACFAKNQPRFAFQRSTYSFRHFLEGSVAVKVLRSRSDHCAGDQDSKMNTSVPGGERHLRPNSKSPSSCRSKILLPSEGASSLLCCCRLAARTELL